MLYCALYLVYHIMAVMVFWLLVTASKCQSNVFLRSKKLNEHFIFFLNKELGIGWHQIKLSF